MSAEYYKNIHVMHDDQNEPCTNKKITTALYKWFRIFIPSTKRKVIRRKINVFVCLCVSGQKLRVKEHIKISISIPKVRG